MTTETIDITQVSTEYKMASYFSKNHFGTWNPDEYFYDEKTSLWYRWLKTHWEPLSKKSFISNVLAPMIMANIGDHMDFQKMKYLSPVENFLAPLLGGKFSYCEYLSFRNCHLRLKDFILCPQSPQIKNPFFFDFDYNPDAVATEALKYLKFQFPNQRDLSYVITMLGTILCPDLITKKFLVLLDDADGFTGKSFFMTNAVAAALGPYACIGSLEWLYGKGTINDTADFEHKLLVTFDELENEIDEGRFKFFGSPTFRVRNLYNKAYDTVLTCKPMGTKNGHLSFKGQRSPALFKRLCSLPFMKVIENAREFDFYRTEYMGILNMLITGAKVYRKIGDKMDIPEMFKSLKEDAISDADRYDGFIEKCIVFEKGNKVKSSDLGLVYAEYMRSQHGNVHANDIQTMLREIPNELKRFGASKTKVGGRGYKDITINNYWLKKCKLDVGT